MLQKKAMLQKPLVANWCFSGYCTLKNTIRKGLEDFARPKKLKNIQIWGVALVNKPVRKSR